MILLFILLPHWNARDSRTYVGNSFNAGFISGFNEEISLENIKNIREDRTKVIVVENIDTQQIERLGLEYFRGKRYNYFNWLMWGSRFPRTTYEYERSFEDNTLSLDINYYLNGSRYLFLPAAPVSISGSDIQLWNFYQDDTILLTQLGINEPVSLKIDFEVWPLGKIIDRSPSELAVSSEISPKVSDIFKEYIDSIPEEIHDSPSELSDYVQNRSGFSYDIQDVSENISDFLYGKKVGHCEYYATVLTVVLQHFWFSPTFVSWYGYGEYNALAGSYIVRASNAHTWVELYDEDTQQWIIYDPTPWQSLSASQFLDTSFDKIIEIYDFIDIKWYTYLVNYAGDTQKNLYLSIFSNIFYIIWIFVLLILSKYGIKYIVISWKFVFLTKREKVLFLLSNKYYWAEKVTDAISLYDATLAIKIEKYLYADSWNLNYRDILRVLRSRRR